MFQIVSYFQATNTIIKNVKIIVGFYFPKIFLRNIYLGVILKYFQIVFTIFLRFFEEYIFKAMF